jgi:cbb3-type cytochrome oxidase subunit 1
MDDVRRLFLHRNPGAALYKQRKTSAVYISVWYLLGAFFWFPWLFFTSNVLLGQPN